MAIEEEPYFGSVTIHYNAHLKGKENQMMKTCAAHHQNVQAKRTKTCESRAPMMLRDPAALVRSLRRAAAMLILSVVAGTRNTTSKRPPTHTADMITLGMKAWLRILHALESEGVLPVLSST